MLELKNITKDYTTGGETVHALRGVSVAFRKSEFVSILGQSGCGKTTLLNIMGGLDQYTDGDLVINGVSTKKYKSSNWDAYRNHTIGFVFQSYNLIPHQTVLANVQLALTLSGVTADEARRRAVEALEAVGLGDQINKHPAQMSGGQMQRVAIARALINDPDILLADEPTGALDSDTSTQIMEILRSIAKDRLVIMVTHNPELAAAYSTRIIRLKDGLIINDSHPYHQKEEETSAGGTGKRLRNKSMSMKTALGLSFKNLLTKKARTILTAFAGSIGIIGIALILSVSSGTQAYIDDLENSTMSSYPLTITSESADVTSMIAAFAEDSDDDETTQAQSSTVKEQQIVTQMFASVGTNDLTAFKKYLENHKDVVEANTSNVVYSYGVTPQIYLTDMKYGVTQVNPSKIMSGSMASAMSSYSSTYSSNTFFELVGDSSDDYEILAGTWPTKYNEMVLVVDEDGRLNDYTAYALGLRDPAELKSMLSKMMKGETVTVNNEPLEWTYDELMSISYSLVSAGDTYRYNSDYGVYEDMSEDETTMKTVIEGGEPLKIVCVAKAKDDTGTGMSTSGVGYLSSLVTHVIDTASNKDIVKAQLANKTTDIFSGSTFEELLNDSQSGLGFEDMIEIDTNALSAALGGTISEDDLTAIYAYYAENISDSITTDTTAYTAALTDALTTSADAVVDKVIETGTEDPEASTVTFTTDNVDTALAMVMAGDTFIATTKTLSELSGGLIPADTFAQMLYQMLGGYGQAMKAFAGFPVPTETLKASVATFVATDEIVEAIKTSAAGITEGLMKANILTDVGSLTQDLISTMASAYHVDADAISAAFSMNMSEDEITRLIQSYTSSNENTTYESNLQKLGYADYDSPVSISLYFKDFDTKETFLDFIDDYNEQMKAADDDELVINYTDVTGILMSSVKSITNAVSYILIAFVAISLVVSSIMIGVITYISVLERTKEIGILRAIGASKGDIMRVFNSETIIVGLCAGLMGIGIALLLIIIINIILYDLTGIASLQAVLSVKAAVILIAISAFLTFIAGLIPSRLASKKDPVEALRAE